MTGTTGVGLHEFTDSTTMSARLRVTLQPVFPSTIAEGLDITMGGSK